MKSQLNKFITYISFFAMSGFSAQANVTLPAIFSDNMVLQQQSEVTIWGWAKPSEKVIVTCSWDNSEVSTQGNKYAQWLVTVKTPTAGGPYSIKIQGNNTILLNDVLIGEVWICSGQSNMEWTANMKIMNAQQEIEAADYPNIRFFSVAHKSAENKQLDVNGRWEACSPETMQNFSAVAYFFGRELQRQLDVPIGLINSSWGGTPAEAWVNPEVIFNDKGLKEGAAKLPDAPWGPQTPGSIYNAMVAPIVPFQIAGALWYQGESNTAVPINYERLLPALIKNWRSEWGYDFPFYYVQIAPYKYGRAYEGALLRDAQRKSMVTPNTGMVVISDIGDINDIHPLNKHDVGKRLANWALNKTYGKTELPVSGPLYKSMEIEKNKARIHFDYAENGLVVKGKSLTHFEIAGEDKKFISAKATIQGNTVVVESKSIKKPVAVRFALHNTAEPNLFNIEGLPASCFRTDDWEVELNKYE
jgi:sialate O-acetylesterase